MADQNMTIGIRRQALRRGAVTLLIALIVIVACLILLGLMADFLVDWLWFSAVGYLNVFWTIIIAEAGVFLAVFVVTGIILWVNGSLASRLARSPWAQRPADFEWDRTGVDTIPDLLEFMRHRRPWPLIIAGVAGLLATFVALWETHHWDVFLRFLYQASYGANDPLYDKDVGFYFFSLPAYVAIKNWMLLTLFLSALLAGAVYWVHGHIEYDPQRRSISPTAIAHGSVLLGCFFAVKAWSYGLDRYLLLYGDNGVVVGAGYTDVHVELPVLWLLMGLAVILAFTCWANLRTRSYKLPIAAVAILFGTSLVAGGIVPALVQRMYVKPNELQLERPYIQHNIALTQQAYNLDQVTVDAFPAEQSLTAKTLEANKATIENVRLWDWQPLMDTYSQMQEIRTYYKFHDLDIDRYWLDGTYHAVMLSARELKSSLLPPNAQTWVNRHLLFTHGNGVVMSPVTRKSSQGLPLFYLRDIPPVASGGPEIHEPRIYYGEETNDYVIVKGSTPEFDYPKGKENIYATYQGSGGIPMGSIARKALFAWYFNDVNLLLSGYITDSSRIMIRRNIQERVRTITPFLRLDHDPYLVVSDGRLFWIQDAYTTSRYFPYAQPVQGRDLNYIRNSVKIVVDGYNGSVDFYLMDAADPIATTYQRIFPGLFKPLQAMPLDLQRHIRYPEDLFFIQAQMYRAYHMDIPEVFYNREDLWQFPRKPDGGQTAAMVPYYIVMRLPGEPRAEFFLMLPMVPSKRENMIAWLAARCDPPNYGKLIVYEFPKDKLVYGPFQVEARINQNTEISQQLSLWNQLGSRVIRGNVLVIPIENSILYVSPLYLRAEQGQLPELKRVIAAYGDQVVMKETLAEALSALFMEPGAEPAAPGAAAGAPLAGAAADWAREALDHYTQAIERLKSGDWAGFGTELDAMRAPLESLNRQAGSPLRLPAAGQ
jgi:uncharacterized membrane protein (UPF0182 family)